MSETTYDSRVDTFTHIQRVQHFMGIAIEDLSRRARVHDQSKLVEPELSAYNRLTPRLKELTYGTEAYKASLRELGPALQHHYENNDHHAEHTTDGIAGMSLLSLLEMICDWRAATERHADGDIRRSIELNQKRFGYDDTFKRILLNTVEVLDRGEIPAWKTKLATQMVSKSGLGVAPGVLEAIADDLPDDPVEAEKLTRI